LAARERSIKLSKGIYVTPKGKFILLIEAANANEVSSKTISKNCLGYVRNGKKYLPKLGWSFTPKN
jgi:hypothetical protein